MQQLSLPAPSDYFLVALYQKLNNQDMLKLLPLRESRLRNLKIQVLLLRHMCRTQTAIRMPMDIARGMLITDEFKWD